MRTGVDVTAIEPRGGGHRGRIANGERMTFERVVSNMDSVPHLPAS